MNTVTYQAGDLVTEVIDGRPGRITGRQVDPFTGRTIKYRVELWPDTKDRQFDTFTPDELESR